MDLDNARLEVAKQLGATHAVNSSSPDAVDTVLPPCVKLVRVEAACARTIVAVD